MMQLCGWEMNTQKSDLRSSDFCLTINSYMIHVCYFLVLLSSWKLTFNPLLLRRNHMFQVCFWAPDCSLICIAFKCNTAVGLLSKTTSVCIESSRCEFRHMGWAPWRSSHCKYLYYHYRNSVSNIVSPVPFIKLTQNMLLDSFFAYRIILHMSTSLLLC